LKVQSAKQHREKGREDSKSSLPAPTERLERSSRGVPASYEGYSLLKEAKKKTQER
jgi:hypothetical protein